MLEILISAPDTNLKGYEPRSRAKATEIGEIRKEARIHRLGDAGGEHVEGDQFADRHLAGNDRLGSEIEGQKDRRVVDELHRLAAEISQGLRAEAGVDVARELLLPAPLHMRFNRHRLQRCEEALMQRSQMEGRMPDQSASVGRSRWMPGGGSSSRSWALKTRRRSRAQIVDRCHGRGEESACYRNLAVSNKTAAKSWIPPVSVRRVRRLPDAEPQSVRLPGSAGGDRACWLPTAESRTGTRRSADAQRPVHCRS